MPSQMRLNILIWKNYFLMWNLEEAKVLHFLHSKWFSDYIPSFYWTGKNNKINVSKFYIRRVLRIWSLYYLTVFYRFRKIYFVIWIVRKSLWRNRKLYSLHGFWGQFWPYKLKWKPQPNPWCAVECCNWREILLNMAFAFHVSY